MHIDDVVLGILSSCVTHQYFYLTWIIPPSSFLFFLAGFDMRVMKGQEHYGSRIMGVFLRPLNEALGSITDIFWWYKLNIMEDYAPYAFQRSWALVVSYFW
jgi:hypothetical protein